MWAFFWVRACMPGGGIGLEEGLLVRALGSPSPGNSSGCHAQSWTKGIPREPKTLDSRNMPLEHIRDPYVEV